jgi:sugar phosphate isomerase/epimerase
MNRHLNRRDAIKTVAAAGTASAVVPAGYIHAAEAAAPTAGLKGNINHSMVYWCFNVTGDKWDLEKCCQVAKQLGIRSIELTGPEDWPTMKKHGLTCAIAPNGMPGAPFMKGLNNPRYHEEVIKRTSEMIEACAAHGVPSVIAFTGFKYRDADDPKSGEISREEGAEHCVKGLKQLAGLAEKKNVTVCIEHLNTRDGTHPMKGHPGYQGDDVDYVANIVRKVGSPRVKLLFDLYHVQIMNGDLIRRLEECKDITGHIHTAGNPGRCELDANQEINFAAAMRKLVDMGYKGWVGHEFIPTRDAFAGLKQAVTVCDV